MYAKRVLQTASFDHPRMNGKTRAPLSLASDIMLLRAFLYVYGAGVGVASFAAFCWSHLASFTRTAFFALFTGRLARGSRTVLSALTIVSGQS
jgi:hypothetical protein